MLQTSTLKIFRNLCIFLFEVYIRHNVFNFHIAATLVSWLTLSEKVFEYSYILEAFILLLEEQSNH